MRGKCATTHHTHPKYRQSIMLILSLFPQREGQYPGLSETSGEKTEGAKRHVGPREEPTRRAKRSGKYQDLHANYLSSLSQCLQVKYKKLKSKLE